MSQYQLYFLTDDDRDVERQDHSCMNDRAAILMGRTLCRDHNIDVWQDGRRVARIAKYDFGLTLRG